MKIYSAIILASMKMYYRNKHAIIWSLVFPVTIMLIFGLFNFERYNPPKLGINDLSNNQISKELITSFKYFQKEKILEIEIDQEPNLENKLMNENPSLNGENQGGLGKAAEDMKQIKRDLENQQITQETIDRGKKVYRRLLEHQQAIKDQGRDNKWEAEQNKNEKLLDNTILNKNNYSTELKNLYKTLDEVDKNKNLEKNNKAIIQEYLRILIKEKVDEK